MNNTAVVNLCQISQLVAWIYVIFAICALDIAEFMGMKFVNIVELQ